MTQNVMHVTPRAEGKILEVLYTISGPWQKVFNLERPAGPLAPMSNGIHKFFCEYTIDISQTPASVLVIPFLCSLMPIAWLYNASVYVDEVDVDFLTSLENVREAYASMYPSLAFLGELIAKPTKNGVWHPKSPPLLLFSGGVDSVYSMPGNLPLKPTLLTIWGADIFFREEAPWRKVDLANGQMAQRFQLGYCTIKSSFRLFFNESVLNENFAKSVLQHWWHGFQYGIGLLGLAAPLAFQTKSKVIIISSSYSSKDSKFSSCGSDPTIDMALRFAGCQCHHYDYTGDNCCLCDKCMRTIFAIYAEGSDPKDFGYPIDDAMQKKIAQVIKNGNIYESTFWEVIVQRLRLTSRTDTHIKALIEYFNLKDLRSSG